MVPRIGRNRAAGPRGQKKSPAVSKAVVDYVKRRKAKELGRVLREGGFDYALTNDEIEKTELYEPGPGGSYSPAGR